jgi:hypothetical protein
MQIHIFLASELVGDELHAAHRFTPNERALSICWIGDYILDPTGTRTLLYRVRILTSYQLP